MNSMLQIDEETQVDDSIQSYKRFAYLPISGTNLNNANQLLFAWKIQITTLDHVTQK